MFELTFTVSCAWRWPAAVTVRVIGWRFAADTCTSAGGGGRSFNPWKAAKPTSPRMSTVAIQRPLVIACSRDSFLALAADGPAECGFCFVPVDEGVGAGELALGELQLGVADLQLGADADLLPGTGQAEVLSRRLHALRGDARLLAGSGQLRDGPLHVGGHRPSTAREVHLGLGRRDVGLLRGGLGVEAREDVPV